MLARTSGPFSAETGIGVGDVGRFWDRVGALATEVRQPASFSTSLARSQLSGSASAVCPCRRLFTQRSGWRRCR